MRTRSFVVAALLAGIVHPAVAFAAAPPGEGPGGEPPPAIAVNGYPVTTDTAPTIVGGRTLVPVRAVSESLGADVSWDGTTRTVTIVRGGRTVVLTIDQRVARVDGQPVELDVPATIVNGRTMVPLRFVGQAFGAEVTWDEATRTAHVRLTERRDGLTPEDVLRRSDEAFRGLTSYRFRGDIGWEISIQEPGGRRDRAAMSVDVSGARQGEEVYLRMEVSDSEAGSQGPVEIYANASGAWSRLPDEPWTADPDAAVMLEELAPGDPVVELRDNGIIPLFEEDAVIDGRRHYVIRLLVDWDALLGSGSRFGAQTLDPTRPGADPDLAGLERQFLDEFLKRVEVRAYVDAGSFLLRKLEAHLDTTTNVAGVTASVQMEYVYGFSDFGAAFEMPRIPEDAAAGSSGQPVPRL